MNPYANISRVQAMAHTVASFQNEPRKFVDDDGSRWTAYPVQHVYAKDRTLGLALAKRCGLEFFLPWYERVLLATKAATQRFWEKVRAYV